MALRNDRPSNLDSVHWTFGVCSEGEQTCLKQRYDTWNITQIAGKQMENDSFDFALLKSLTKPNIGSLSCEELCNYLSCGHGHCSDQEDQDQCPGDKSGFICRCSNSPSYPLFKTILLDMLSTGNACRQCNH